MIRNDILEKKEIILEWISKNQSKSFICKELNCKPSTLDSYLKKMDIKYNGNQGGKGIKTDSKRISAIELTKRKIINSHKLKLRLLEDNIKEHICENCGGTEWLGKPIPLELHHINGNKFNNSLDNIQLLCPNCHSLTPNYSGSKK